MTSKNNTKNSQEENVSHTDQSTKQKVEADLKVAKINMLVAIVTGLLTLAGVIVTALLAPLAIEIVRHLLTSTSTPVPIATEFVMPPPTEAVIDEPNVFILPTLTLTLPTSRVDVSTVTPQAVTETMTVQLTFSSSAGKAPLMVNFNAKNSYLSRTDGTTLSCIEKNVCSYSWDVRLGSTSIYGPKLGDSAFSYTFQKKGEYVVVVYVCRGEACNYSAASISVK